MPHEPSSRWLVSTDWLAERLGASDIVVVDGSSYLSTMQRDAAAEYLAGHIPGAVRFDIDAIADHSNPLPHMLPDATQFARDVGALGIADTDTIVVYDGAGLYSAPRVWWTFRLFGADKVFILDGGLPKWRQEGRPIAAVELLLQLFDGNGGDREHASKLSVFSDQFSVFWLEERDAYRCPALSS